MRAGRDPSPFQLHAVRQSSRLRLEPALTARGGGHCATRRAELLPLPRSKTSQKENNTYPQLPLEHFPRPFLPPPLPPSTSRRRPVYSRPPAPPKLEFPTLYAVPLYSIFVGIDGERRGARVGARRQSPTLIGRAHGARRGSWQSAWGQVFAFLWWVLPSSPHPHTYFGPRFALLRRRGRPPELRPSAGRLDNSPSRTNDKWRDER